MQFIKDITDIASTRKFWLAFIAALGNAALVFLADQPKFAPVFTLLMALGVYRVPNK